MCGIAGFFAADQAPGPWFEAALHKAAHRGPDGSGWWTAGMNQAGHFPGSVPTIRDRGLQPMLGHLRLSILDLSEAGSQPMVVPGRAAVILNGEIYNYLELREVLLQEGWTFQSSSDTEVLLKGWLAWGWDLLPKLNGMWAAAIYDESKKGMLLTRDRFGEKPLFWTPWKGGLAFASEIKQLGGFPDLPLEADPQRMAAFLATGRPYDGSSTWFKGIRQLDPGAWLWIDAEGIREGRYHDLEAEVGSVRAEATAEAWAERFGEALTQSVRLRLRSDVPVGGCLSAGLDSSAIMAKAMKLPLKGEYHSFTLGSDDPLIDESAEAKVFAGQMGSKWHGVWADGSEFGRLWDRMTWHQETPLASTSLYGQWKVLEAARGSGVIVILDGQGADEILGGYHKFFVGHIRRTMKRNPIKGAVNLWRFLRHVGGAPRLLRYGYRYMGGLGGGTSPASLLKVGLYRGEHAPSIQGSGLGMRLADIQRWSLPNLLSYEDRNAMAHSVETRLPYLDPEVLRLSLAMEEDILFKGGWTKWPLRRALDGDGGAEVAWRRGKRQFFAPQSGWLRESLAEPLRAWLAAPHPLLAEAVDMDRLRRYQEEWKTRKPSHSGDDQVFQMMSLDRFLRVWFPS